jgi:hypothetical protein
VALLSWILALSHVPAPSQGEHRSRERAWAKGIRFSISFGLTEPVRDAILAMPESAWVPAITHAGEEREGAAVCELANLGLSAWPQGTRAICRREWLTGVPVPELTAEYVPPERETPVSRSRTLVRSASAQHLCSRPCCRS